MKGFKKWDEENCGGTECIIIHDAGCDAGCDACVALRKIGWKAALEWVLDQLDYSIEHKEIGDKIYKELEE